MTPLRRSPETRRPRPRAGAAGLSSRPGAAGAARTYRWPSSCRSATSSSTWRWRRGARQRSSAPTAQASRRSAPWWPACWTPRTARSCWVDESWTAPGASCGRGGAGWRCSARSRASSPTCPCWATWSSRCAARGWAERRRRVGPAPSWPLSGPITWPPAREARSREGRRPAWRWPERWRRGPACWSWMSRWPPWT